MNASFDGKVCFAEVLAISTAVRCPWTAQSKTMAIAIENARQPVKHLYSS